MIEMGDYVLRAALALPRVLRELRPDACIVFFSLPCGPLGRLAKTLRGVPYVVSLRGGDVPGTEAHLNSLHRCLAPIRHWVLRGSKAVVANSSGLKALSEKADPIPVTVIANGVDTTAFAPRSRQPNDRFRFLFVGRLNTQKNVALLLSAAERLRRQTALPFHLKIVGDGPLAGDLHELADKSDLRDIVEWQPWVPRENMPDVYASADCLVNPSLYEGMPNVVLEGMACGLPVIASDVAGNNDLVKPSMNGLLFGSGDCDSLVAAMHRAMGDRLSSAAWGAAGRADVVLNYSWQAAAKQYLEMLAQSQPPSRFRPAGEIG
jgi:glycosyltransferase involved in cell wall biosynthesis